MLKREVQRIFFRGRVDERGAAHRQQTSESDSKSEQTLKDRYVQDMTQQEDKIQQLSASLPSLRLKLAKATDATKQCINEMLTRINNNMQQDQDFWIKCLDCLSDSIPAQDFNIWFKPVQAFRKDKQLMLFVPNNHVYEKIKANYFEDIEKIANQLSSTPIKIVLNIGSISDVLK